MATVPKQVKRHFCFPEINCHISVRHTQMETGAEPGVFVVNQSNVIALLRVNKMLMNQIQKVVPGVTCVTI